MYFVVQKSILEDAVKNLQRVIPNKPALPILADIMFDVKAKDKTACLTASDGEISLEYQIDLDKCEGDYRFTVPAKTLANMLGEVSEQPLEIFVSEEEAGQFHMDYQDGDAYCPTGKADEYPTIAKLEDAPRLVIVDGNQLQAGLRATAFAAAEDLLRPAMNGVYFTSTGSTDANMVASDGHVLMKDTIEIDATGSPFGVIIPNKVVKILMNLLDPDDKVHIQISDRTVVVDTMSMTLTFRQTEGPYPNWMKVIPSDFSRSLKVDRKKLISALKAVAPFTSDASNMVTFRIDVGNITIEGADYDMSIGSERRVECSFTEDSKTTDSMSIGFKAKSLITMLSKFACQEVVINLTDPSRAATLEPYKEEDKDLHLFLGLVMPMILNE